jgi:molybdate transport system ATP-binding protein
MSGSLCIDATIASGSFVRQVQFRAEHGVSVIVGPSASGKSLTLRCLAGLHRISKGEIRFGDRVWDNAKQQVVPAGERSLGYAPQESALWPHWTIEQHISALTNDERTGHLLEIMEISQLAHRKAVGLSGGERQRVALARALARKPVAVLLDEPYSALPRAMRTDIHRRVVEEAAKFQCLVLLVTHDLDPVSGSADQIISFDG